MKVDYISDIHLDFWIKEQNDCEKLDAKISSLVSSLGILGGEVIVVAGDLGHRYVQDTKFLLQLRKMYNHVLFVKGNHDLYMISKTIVERYDNNPFLRVDAMKQFCSSNGIDYMDGDVKEINGVTFGGTGLSWDRSFVEKLWEREVSDEEIINLFKNTMNDARLIPGFKPLEYMESELVKLDDIMRSKIDVMVSHYSPCIPPDMSIEFGSSPITTFYYFDGSEQLNRINPKYWIYGHTHTATQYMKNETMMLCNPLGYPGENYGCKVKHFEV